MNNKKINTKVTEKANVSADFVFAKQNYILMIIGVAVITLGFALMYGKEDIYNFKKLTIAPLVVMAGFIIEIFAILYKPKNSK